MNKQEVVKAILDIRLASLSHRDEGQAFAPTNIALCKYWGKRDVELNLPVTSSLSISLEQKGAKCIITASQQTHDIFILNDKPMDLASPFGRRLTTFLNLFRISDDFHFHINMQMNIPFAAGLASSACGFASVVLALNSFFNWQLNPRELSILARLGSGSACRSIFSGFVEWHAGVQADGMDSYAEPLLSPWPELCLGLLIVNDKEKPLASRDAMERTVATSSLYSAWPAKASADLQSLKQAIKHQDFQLLGETAESNALTMHALMLSAWPPVSYAIPETLLAMQKVWQLRKQGMALYFTQDAGPNLKLLFLKQDQEGVCQHFSSTLV